jgi:hypothetical protein
VRVLIFETVLCPLLASEPFHPGAGDATEELLWALVRHARKAA